MIYVACPAHHATGGTEVLHQFAHSCIAQGAAASMLYLRYKPRKNPDPVAERFKQYAVPYSTSFADITAQDALVVPEVATEELYSWGVPRKCKRALWWLSVDSYQSIIGERRLRKRLFRSRRFSFQDTGVIHFYQSEYARQFLESNSAPQSHHLSDYLNADFLEAASQPSPFPREDFVAYNPAKGFEITQRIIQHCGDGMRFVQLKGMTPRQMRETLQKAKVYIDFGHHPGKDRIPREAALSGCCVITNSAGSAANPVDLPIADEFKFATQPLDLDRLRDKLSACLNDFDVEQGKFRAYRESILREPARFQADVRNAVQVLLG